MLSIETGRKRFLDAAKLLFHLDSDEGRGRRNQYYRDVPVRVSDDFFPGEGSPAGQRRAFVNPLLFLSGIYNDRTPTPDQSFAVSPSLSLIIGEYGWGKTELIFQLCDHMANSVEIPLPINLSLCRDAAGVLDQTPTAETMATLLFGKVAEVAGVDPSFALEQIVPEIRSGRIILLLDGLDELVSATAQHRAFFTGLLKLLSEPGDAESFFRVSVSMRLEYLSSVAPDPEEIARLVDRESSGSVAIYFVMLEPLGDSHIKAYLSARSAEVPNLLGIFEEVKTHPHLLEMLRRPLLLRIFCDVARFRNFNLDALMRKLQSNDGLAGLLNTLTESAASDEQLRDAQQLLVPVIWKPETLAMKALQLYRAGRTWLTIGDVADILVPAPGAQVDIASLPPEMVLKGIHKCPFLQEETTGTDWSSSKPVAEFAHKIFYEYFVALGMADEMRRDRGGSAGKRMFDELVLSVDMRKFLRGFLEETDWREQTAFAYGLHDPEEWPELDERRQSELEARRWILLRSMTDPENLPPETAETIRWLLGGDTGWLHPRYLLYNFEAVAVYLWYQRKSPEAPGIRERFGEVLQAKLQELLNAPRGPRQMRRANALLTERILDIGRRIRYPWAEDCGDSRADEIINSIDPEDADIVSRIRIVLEDIRQAVFLKAGRTTERPARQAESA